MKRIEDINPIRTAIYALLVLQVVISLLVLPAFNRTKFFIFSAWRPFSMSLEPFSQTIVLVEKKDGSTCAYHECEIFDVLNQPQKKQIFVRMENIYHSAPGESQATERELYFHEAFKWPEAKSVRWIRRTWDFKQTLQGMTGFTDEEVFSEKLSR